MRHEPRRKWLEVIRDFGFAIRYERMRLVLEILGLASYTNKHDAINHPTLLGFVPHPNLRRHMQYRRANVTAGTYFFTVNLAERKRTLLVDYIDDLRNTMKKVKASHPFRIDAMVVLPDHLHAVWTLPEGDADYPMRWSLIKAGFSRCVPKDERRNPSRIAKGERGIWQRRYWEHLIREERDYAKHVEYIHYNPVKHGYVARVVDWTHSTFHRYVKDGIYPENWAGNPLEEVNGE